MYQRWWRVLISSRLQSWLRLLNTTFAVAGVLIPLLYPSPDKPAREYALALAAVLFAAGAVLGTIAEWKVENIARDSDIERLINDATALRKKDEPDQPANAPDLSDLISAVSLVGAGLCWLAGLFMIYRLKVDQSLWPAVTAVAVGEAIYLSCCFERGAKKAELEALAVGWADVRRNSANASLSPAWASRALELRAVVQPQKLASASPDPTSGTEATPTPLP